MVDPLSLASPGAAGGSLGPEALATLLLIPAACLSQGQRLGHVSSNSLIVLQW